MLSSSIIFFAIVPKLVIFVLFIRISYLGFFEYNNKWRYYIVIIAILSRIVGSFSGLAQKKLKTLLAYSFTSHMGYTLIALTAGTIEAMQSKLVRKFLKKFTTYC